MVERRKSDSSVSRPLNDPHTRQRVHSALLAILNLVGREVNDLHDRLKYGSTLGPRTLAFLDIKTRAKSVSDALLGLAIVAAQEPLLAKKIAAQSARMKDWQRASGIRSGKARAEQNVERDNLLKARAAKLEAEGKSRWEICGIIARDSNINLTQRRIRQILGWEEKRK